MIRAFIFDLDGTLVETEMLKARAYAAIAQDLLVLDEPCERAIELYRRLVGATDETVARAMIDELGLAGRLPVQDGPRWLSLHRLHTERYEREFATGDALRAAAYPDTLELLRRQAHCGMAVAVATSSFTAQASRVTRELGVESLLDALIGRDQVTMGKPHPEIYLKAAGALGVSPAEAIVIEDSPTGLEAAVRAGMPCVAVASAFSADALRAQSMLPQEWCVYDRSTLARMVERRLAAESPG